LHLDLFEQPATTTSLSNPFVSLEDHNSATGAHDKVRSRRYNAAMTISSRPNRSSMSGLWPAAALLGVALCAVPAVGTAAGSPAVAPLADRRPVCIRGVCFESEIAVTAAERSRGLMYREALAKDRGMLFVFPEEGLHRFWMKHTRIELDIIFIAADRRVVSISHRAQPCREEPCNLYSPLGNVAYALEIAGGLATAYGFTAGDLVEFRGTAAGR
jgi:uncharacterized membrane protein (UPF0127 family)